MKNRKFKIIAAQSSIDWIGRKVTGAHNGIIDIKEGNLVLQDDRLVGGEFVVDTKSIRILDITDLSTNVQFAGHLASADFFASEQYPDALFTISSALQNGDDHYEITGDLTIRGITHPAHFDAKVNILDGNLVASGRIVVDRTLYGMKFRSGNFFKDLGDVLIYNEFDLLVHITAKETTKQQLAEMPMR